MPITLPEKVFGNKLWQVLINIRCAFTSGELRKGARGREGPPYFKTKLRPEDPNFVLRRLNPTCFNIIVFIAYFLVPPKLDIDLGSSVSSVSDPDISGMSDKEPAKKDDQRKDAHAAEPAKPGDESQSEGKVSSYVSLFPGRPLRARLLLHPRSALNSFIYSHRTPSPIAPNLKQYSTPPWGKSCTT